MKKLAMVLMLCFLVVSVAGCAGMGKKDAAASGSGSAAGGKTITLKFDSVKTQNDPEYGWWTKFMQDISNKSGGSIKYEMYPAESLGKQADMLEAAQHGEPVLVDCDLNWLSKYVPDFSIGMAPYLLQKPEDIQKFWESEPGKRMCAELEKKDLHLVTLCYFGTRDLLCKKEVHSRADIANMKIRCASSPMWNEVVRVLGGQPTNTAWSETYQALSQGIADGAESPYTLLYSAKLYEPCKYLIKTEHLVAPTAIVMSQKVYESLTPEGKKAIDEIGHAYPAQAIKNVQGVEKEYIDKLQQAGVKIIDIDKTEFIEASKETPSHFKDWTPGLYEEIKAALAK